MNKVLIASCFIAILIVSGAFAATLVHNINMQNVAGTEATGEARMTIQDDRNGGQKVNIRLRTWNLFVGEDRIFEGWLVDDDTGYKLSLGAFHTQNNGRGSFSFRQRVVNTDVYDKLVITSEPLDDIDPNPDQPILVALIPEGGNGIPNNDQIIELQAMLTGDQEVPPADTNAFGSGTFMLNKQENTLQFHIVLSGPPYQIVETESHLHGTAPVGEEAGILFELPTGNVKDGIWNYEEEIENDIINGLTYVNVHSIYYPEGEIRGQIVPVNE